LEEIKNTDYPLLFCKINLIESINKDLKKILISKKLSCTWLKTIKKIIIFSHNKSTKINNIRDLNKNTKKIIEKKRCLNFLNKYTDFYIKKYLFFYEKADIKNIKLKY